jgi:hypothetical protein
MAFTCPEPGCNYTTDNTHTFESHRRIHVRKPCPVTGCEKSFGQNARVRSHLMAIHHWSKDDAWVGSGGSKGGRPREERREVSKSHGEDGRDVNSGMSESLSAGDITGIDTTTAGRGGAPRAVDEDEDDQSIPPVSLISALAEGILHLHGDLITTAPLLPEPLVLPTALSHRDWDDLDPLDRHTTWPAFVTMVAELHGDVFDAAVAAAINKEGKLSYRQARILFFELGTVIQRALKKFARRMSNTSTAVTSDDAVWVTLKNDANSRSAELRLVKEEVGRLTERATVALLNPDRVSSDDAARVLLTIGQVTERVRRLSHEIHALSVRLLRYAQGVEGNGSASIMANAASHQLNVQQWILATDRQLARLSKSRHVFEGLRHTVRGGSSNSQPETHAAVKTPNVDVDVESDDIDDPMITWGFETADEITSIQTEVDTLFKTVRTMQDVRKDDVEGIRIQVDTIRARVRSLTQTLVQNEVNLARVHGLHAANLIMRQWRAILLRTTTHLEEIDAAVVTELRDGIISENSSEDEHERTTYKTLTSDANTCRTKLVHLKDKVRAITVFAQNDASEVTQEDVLQKLQEIKDVTDRMRVLSNELRALVERFVYYSEGKGSTSLMKDAESDCSKIRQWFLVIKKQLLKLANSRITLKGLRDAGEQDEPEDGTTDGDLEAPKVRPLIRFRIPGERVCELNAPDGVPSMRPMGTGNMRVLYKYPLSPVDNFQRYLVKIPRTQEGGSMRFEELCSDEIASLDMQAFESTRMGRFGHVWLSKADRDSFMTTEGGGDVHARVSAMSLQNTTMNALHVKSADEEKPALLKAYIKAVKLAIGRCEHPACRVTCQEQSVAMFDFAHLDASTKICNPSSLWSRTRLQKELGTTLHGVDIRLPELSMGLAFAEASKCFLLCKPHHRVATEAHKLGQTFSVPMEIFTLFTSSRNLKSPNQILALLSEPQRNLDDQSMFTSLAEYMHGSLVFAKEVAASGPNGERVFFHTNRQPWRMCYDADSLDSNGFTEMKDVIFTREELTLDVKGEFPVWSGDGSDPLVERRRAALLQISVDEEEEKAGDADGSDLETGILVIGNSDDDADNNDLTHTKVDTRTSKRKNDPDSGRPHKMQKADNNKYGQEDDEEEEEAKEKENTDSFFPIEHVICKVRDWRPNKGLQYVYYVEDASERRWWCFVEDLTRAVSSEDRRNAARIVGSTPPDRYRDEYLQWLKGTRKHMPTGAVVDSASNVLNWDIDHNYKFKNTTHATAVAAEYGRLGILKWLRANKCAWDEVTCTRAAGNGHLEVLEWARGEGCPWDERTCAAAASHGHLTILEWARRNGCKWNEKTCASAASGGHLEVLKWAREEGCPWNENTCSSAKLGGRLHVLEWAITNGCPQ